MWSGGFCFFSGRRRIHPAGRPEPDFADFPALSGVFEANILIADCNNATGAGCP
jgi:hypothetical protein